MMSNAVSFDINAMVPWLLTVVTGLLGFLGYRLYGKQDAADSKHDELVNVVVRLNESHLKLSGAAVTHTQFVEMDMRSESRREERHRENLQRFTSIEHKLDGHGDVGTRLRLIEQEIDRLRDWKHQVVDPYIPGAVDAIKAQLDRIEDQLRNETLRRRSNES
jgi:hypothetical protein